MAGRTRLNDGDLLRAWHALAADEHGTAAQVLQFWRTEQAQTPSAELTPSNSAQDVDLGEKEPLPTPVPAPTPTQPPAVLQMFWRVTEVLREPDDTGDGDEPDAAAEPVDDAVFCSPVEASAPPHEAPLMRPGELMRRLRWHLVRSVEERLPDLPAAVRWMASGQPLHRLPPSRHQRLPGKVQVVIEASSTLGPLRHDFIPVLDLLGRWLGPRQRLLRAEGSPHWISDARSLPSQVRLDGSPVVVLGDAGLLARSGEAVERWRHLGQALVQAGHRPMLLLPASAQRVEPELAQVFEVVAMDGDASEPPAVPYDAADPVRWLRAAIFGNTYVRPGLLRRLRRVLQRRYPLDTASEAQLWVDPAVVSNISACALLPEHRPAAEADFAALPLDLREAVIEAHLEELASMSPLVRAEYVLWVTRHVPAGSRLRLVLDEVERAADRLMAQVGGRLRAGDDVMAANLEGHMLGFRERSETLLVQGSDALQRAWVMAWRRTARPGDEATLPEGLRLERLGGLLKSVLGTQPLQLVLQGRGAGVEVSVERAESGGASAVLHRTEGIPLWRLELAADDAVEGPVRRVGDRVEWRERVGFQVRIGDERVRVEPFSRPDWAESIWFDQFEWHAALSDGRELIWTLHKHRADNSAESVIPWTTLPRRVGCWWDADDRAAYQETIGLALRPNAWASRAGVDQIGRFFEFTVSGRRGPITQRMRFIPPGEFLMGSPEDEKGRYGSERQHPVLLTQGYWLADTACTQELWEAVMGKNPSRFTDDPQNPVEQVSWDDITQKFLPRLNKLVPGLNLTLPTEAQWEYACRAGTTTVFSFGDQITPEQVNYDGNYPYADGKKGKYRNNTVRVKELPANPWGLYQMHGNVWEWCMDELAAYPEGTLIDPVVHQDRKESRQRVLRGGGWIRYGGYCRSAFRYAGEPGVRLYDFGFRLARGLADQPDQPRHFEFGQPEAGGAARNLKQKAKHK